MRHLEDFIIRILEALGFEASKLSLGDLWPGVLLSLFPTALVGGLVSDWKWAQKSKSVRNFPSEWIASIATMAVCLWFYTWLFLS